MLFSFFFFIRMVFFFFKRIILISVIMVEIRQAPFTIALSKNDCDLWVRNRKFCTISPRRSHFPIIFIKFVESKHRSLLYIVVVKFKMIVPLGNGVVPIVVFPVKCTTNNIRSRPRLSEIRDNSNSTFILILL